MFALSVVAVLCGAAVLVGMQWNAPEPRLSATLEIRRIPGDERVVAIAVTNHEAEPVTIERAELVSRSLDSTGPISVDVTVPSGAIRDVFVEYGSGICGGDLAPASEPAVASLWLSSGHRPEVPLPYPNGALDRLLTADCTHAFLAATATVSFSGWVTEPDGSLRVDLVIKRVGGDAPIRVDRVSGNPHYALAPVDRAEPVATMAADEARLVIAGHVDANRCDPHALAEAKQPFYFPVWLSIGDIELIPGAVDVSTEDAAEIEVMGDARCSR